jgi:hypothetical protein
VALIDSLKSGALPIPTLIARAPGKPIDRMGLLTPSFSEGSLLLKDHDGKYSRLLWDKDDAKTDERRRGIAPGHYKLTGYHVVRRDKQDKEWFLWINLRAGRTLDVKPGALDVSADDTITINCKAKRGAGGVEIIAVIMGDHHAGVTIYKEGKRIPIHYRVSDKDKQTLATGTLEYG